MTIEKASSSSSSSSPSFKDIAWEKERHKKREGMEFLPKP